MIPGSARFKPANTIFSNVHSITIAFSEVLTAPWFKYGALPGIATGFALLMKLNSRPDARPGGRDDWAVGFDLCQVSLFAILGDGVTDAVRLFKTATSASVREDLANRLAELPWILIGMLGILVLVSYVVRKAGWTKPVAPALPELNLFGAVFPLIIGIVYVISAIMWMGENHG